MVSPNEVAAMAAKKEKENYAFRTYLKSHADPNKLDRQFLKLHRELFAKYDCNACRNCCKQYCGNLSEEDLPGCAELFGMTPEEFKAKYLRESEDGTYNAIHKPCDFLQEDGSCMLGDQKPDSCADFPYTARPDRIGSLYSIIEFAAVCPVLYEMLERLKKEYGFTCYRSNSRRR